MSGRLFHIQIRKLCQLVEEPRVLLSPFTKVGVYSLPLWPGIVQSLKDCHIAKCRFSLSVVEEFNVSRVGVPGSTYC
jgi:hypothetical protein